MQIVELEINGFRGVQTLRVHFDSHTVIIGPNGCGKTTIMDALALVLGRERLIRTLTDHDFFGCTPNATARIRLVATIVGFPGDDPSESEQWFRDGRAVERWWDPGSLKVVPVRSDPSQRLCVQIGLAARFDHDTLEVESLRYFHDDDSVTDPFGDDAVQTFPASLLQEIGFFLVPAKRTWDRLASFESELFRRLIRTTRGVPSEALIAERDRLRSPESPLESEEPMKPLVGHINHELSRLFPGSPEFRLRLTATDTAGLLETLVPHYQYTDGALLPAGRHGTGLLSLQTLILLLEFGRLRSSVNESFILAVEEPELHLPPALQRRALHRAQAVSNQTIVTSHSPHVAAFFRPTQICVLRSPHSEAASPPRLLESELADNTPNAIRKLLLDNRQPLVDALMHTCVLVPEGRIDYEMLRHLVAMTETSEGWRPNGEDVPVAFGTAVGVVPTHDAAVVATFETLRRVRDSIVPLVDGDAAGDEYVKCLQALKIPPSLVLQLPEDWAIEHVVGWIVEDEQPSLWAELSAALDKPLNAASTLVDALSISTSDGGLKGDYLSYETLFSTIRSREGVLSRARHFLDGMCAAVCNPTDPVSGFESVASSNQTIVLRWSP